MNAFQKKSQRTPRSDIELAKRRYVEARGLTKG
ncbi:MAG: type II toxin-antitoxin system RelE/ParE family toxin, partial [Betaproteobacteria bacterium]